MVKNECFVLNRQNFKYYLVYLRVNLIFKIFINGFLSGKHYEIASIGGSIINYNYNNNKCNFFNLKIKKYINK